MMVVIAFFILIAILLPSPFPSSSLSFAHPVSSSSSSSSSFTDGIFSSFHLVPLHIPSKTIEIIPDRYIAVFRQVVSPQTVQRLVSSYNLQLFQIGSFRALVGKLNSTALKELRLTKKTFKFIEAEKVVTTQDTQINPPSWATDRVDQRSLPLDQRYYYNGTAGSGVRAFILDTGIYLEHSDLEGRAAYGFKYDSSWQDTDGNGHGTFVSGVVAGYQYGIAKKSKLVSVKVLGDSGTGSTAGVIAGVEWVAANGTPKKDLAVMSLGGSISLALDAAVAAAVQKGITFFVAGGNSNSDACNFSPGREPSVITVFSTDITDTRASSSNYGSCGTIFAPGVSVTSLWIGSPTAIRALSGSSVATPHVAGVAAIIQGENGLTPERVKETIISMATKDIVKNPGPQSPNFLLFGQNPGL